MKDELPPLFYGVVITDLMTFSHYTKLYAPRCGLTDSLRGVDSALWICALFTEIARVLLVLMRLKEVLNS